MTGFDTTFDPQPPAATKTSGLAITSLIFSLIVCCPVTTIIGPLLGLGALFQIGRNPALKGRGLAFAAIIMGVAFSIAQGIGMYQGYQAFVVPVVEGPRVALEAGFANDPTGFRAEFYGASTAGSDAEVQVFVDELRRRYGGFVSLRLDETNGPQPAFGQTSVPFPYEITFENASVAAEAELVIADKATGAFVMKWGSITIFDPDLGDLTYPLSGDDGNGLDETDETDDADTDDEAESAPGDDPADTDDQADSDPDAGDGD